MPEAAVAIDFAGNSSGRGGKSILVADGERHVARLIQVNLERLGHEVRVACESTCALEMARKHQPDLAIIGDDLPTFDGREVYLQIREDPEMCEIPVIAVTRSIQDYEVYRSWPGVEAYITKPFDPKKLNDLVWRIFNER